MKTKSYLLVTDLDHTLVGEPEAMKRLFNYYEQEELNPAIVYVTGRHVESALSLMEQEQLPKPDLLVSDVGTTIFNPSTFKEDDRWTAWVNENWQPDRIVAIAEKYPALKRQSLPHKRRVSFTVNDDSEAVTLFEQELLDEKIPHHFIFSSDRDIDILPARSGKGKAVEYVIRNFAKEDVNVLIAGDSGNDAEMLSLSYPAVIVGNAQKELDALPSHALLYRASGHYANGIQEAWEHFYSPVS